MGEWVRGCPPRWMRRCVGVRRGGCVGEIYSSQHALIPEAKLYRPLPQ